MKYVIIWDYVDKDKRLYTQEISFDNREEANNAWKEMKQNGCFINMRHETRGAKKKYFAVRVQFCQGGKYYTYLSKIDVKIGDAVVVRSDDGLIVLAVQWAGELTKTQLEQICPLSKFKYIYGKVQIAK